MTVEDWLQPMVNRLVDKHPYAFRRALVKNDHLKWGKEVKLGGYIIHHDLTDERPDASCAKHLLKLRDEILEHQADCIEVHQQAGLLMVFRKTSQQWTTF